MIKTSKRKKVNVIIILMGALFLLVNWTGIRDKLEPGYMSARIIDADSLNALLLELEETQEKPELSFNGHSLAYDAPSELYYATQNMENGVWDGMFTCEDGRLYWQEDDYFERYEQAIAEGHIFTLYCVDRHAGWYGVYRIVFTGMPMIDIVTQTGAPIGDDVQTAQVQIWDMKFTGSEYQSTACEVSVRGQGSRNFEKQGYKLTLEHKLSLLGMRRDDDWLLGALYDDDGLIHNKMSYDVWNAIASDNTVAKDNGTNLEYVELFCNNTYMGVYSLMERIDAKQIPLGKNDIMYKCRGFATPDETIEEDFGLGVDYDIKYPKSYDRDDWIPLKNYLDIFAVEGVKDYDAARALLDMENAIDYNIFIILARACDNYVRKNTFFIADYDQASGTYKMVKVPWDCNATWGNGLYKGNIDRKLYSASWAHCAYVWSDDIKSMYKCYPDEIREMTLVRWKQLRKDILSEERLFHMLDENFAYLHNSGAYDRNYVRWNEHGREHWKDEYIYEYVENRLQFLDAYFEEPYFDAEALSEEE